MGPARRVRRNRIPVLVGAALLLAASARPAAADAACAPGGTVLCLASRFQVQAVWTTATAFGYGSAVATTSGSGYFTFFGADSPEVIVKAIDGCAFNGRFWIFAAGMTNVEVTLTVEDQQTHIVRTYFNPLGRAFVTQMDTNAFPACPESLPCANPAPLYGELHPETPGYIVVYRQGTDVAAETARLAARYGFVAQFVFQSAILGFSAQLTPETVSALRCEPSVQWIEFDVPVYPAGRTASRRSTQ